METAAAPVLDWRAFQTEGLGYLDTVKRATEKKSKIFSPPIRYNLLAMAVEKMMMAVLMANGTLADNHTFSDLVECMQRVAPLEGDLVDELLHYQSYQEICSPYDGYSRKTLDDAVIMKMIGMVERLAIWSERELVAVSELGDAQNKGV